VLPSGPASHEVFSPEVRLVVQAFATVGVIVTGVMGRLMMSQLHLDFVPGTAVGVPPGPLKGYEPSFDTH
jgi:hypothetical protein